MTQKTGQASGGRALGLDALRGLAILTMVLSGIIPFGELPAWMYHAQLPPPDHGFDPEVRGITWVDLVFPFFLFSMGVAIPLAFTKRMEAGGQYLNMLKKVAERGFLLGFFAIYLHHVRPFVLEPSDPDPWVWWAALAGGALLFPIYTRLPKTWSPKVQWGIRLAGFAGAIALLAVLRYPDGSGFSLHRSDIILIVLTNMAVFTSLIWLATPKRQDLRLGVLVLLAACMLSAEESGWIAALWDSSPVPWLFQFDYLKYLFILIPGTMVGDRLVYSMKHGLPEPSQTDGLRNNFRYWILSVSGIVLMVVLLAGLLGRYVFPTVVVSALILAGGLMLVWKQQNENDSLFRSLLVWGAFWLMLGLLLESFEGGIRKDHATFSYFFVTTGIAIWVMVSLMIWIDVFRGTRLFSLLVQNGQNPMIAYAGMQNFVLPVLTLTGIHEFLVSATEHDPWLGVLRAVAYTVLLAVIVSWLTRKRVFWRS
ncbi:DUF5009 domain-containing protein [Natronogracilivirga saccharolytica]|uniref:DUF5009 domain-containing protein n=1 Tax=Natronogracilivirga saccharolytica TaxID=2812953 RepID=A0A8J7UT12_9BACT|nr:DUF5009 domain-containing protein [Natronogracilivirga saccharolytica]MBP3192141.1 DUF5009 domain-containing protein [Natronogracilivirga saccharolytica]